MCMYVCMYVYICVCVCMYVYYTVVLVPTNFCACRILEAVCCPALVSRALVCSSSVISTIPVHDPSGLHSKQLQFFVCFDVLYTVIREVGSLD
jgi:hypothetical protein